MAMSPGEFAAAWSVYGELTTFDDAVTECEGLPMSAREFLTHAGLPAGEDLVPPIGRISRTLPLLEELRAGPEEQAPAGKTLRVFAVNSSGRQVTSYLCLEEPGGAAYKVERSIHGKFEPSFMNSSIEQFAEFVLKLKRYNLWIEDQIDRTPNGDINEVDDQRTAAMAARAAEELRYCDAAACAEADHYNQHGRYFSREDQPDQVWTQIVLDFDRNLW